MYYQQQQVDTSGLHHHSLTPDYTMPINAYDRGGCSSSGHVSANLPSSHQSQPPPNQVVRAKQLQHQMSDSSSNSNLSGSNTTGQLEGNIYEKQQQATNSSEHQKSISSASATSPFYQQSPQHKMSTSSAGGSGSGSTSYQQHPHFGRQDILRRGNTSVAMTGGGHSGDLAGSQSALSDAGDLSFSQASHSIGSRGRVSIITSRQ